MLFRDRWLCYLCRRPVIFNLALKRLTALVKHSYPDLSVAYWHANWRRDAAPLLDELAASIDHVKASTKAGAHDASNFAAICARCNARKSAKDLATFQRELRPWRVKSKYGEPVAWDGMAAVFVSLAQQNPTELTATERAWLAALATHLAVPLPKRRGFQP